MSMIYLIRHGQASFGKEDYDQLSPLGKRQAHILAQHFLNTGFHPDAAYSGTMARQTRLERCYPNIMPPGGTGLISRR